MIARELIDIVREDFLDDVSDAGDGYTANARWSDAFLLRQLAEAQRQACYRHDLRHLWDNTTPAVCEIAVTAGTQRYAIDRRVLRIDNVRLDTDSLTQTTAARLDERGIDWRTASLGVPASFFIEGRTLVLNCPPSADNTLHLTVWREPLLSTLTETDDLEWLDNQLQLGHWVAFKAFSLPDEDTRRLDLAQQHLALFTATFGPEVPPRVRAEILAMPSELWLGPLTPFDQPTWPARRRPFDFD